MPIILTSPVLAIVKTFLVKFEATKIALLTSFCCIIIAIELLSALTTSILSVVYTIVSNCVLSPKTIKLELIVKFPFTSRLLLYLLLTINLFAALGSS